MRSRAAASILAGAGFKDVHSMAGGIHAWEGLIAEGPPEVGMAHFAPATKPEEMIALAWILEEGSRRFYAELKGTRPEEEVESIFSVLAAAEEAHKANLFHLYLNLSGKSSDPEFPGSLIRPEKVNDVMEGGMRVSEGLEWIKGKGLEEILEFSVSLEANSYDLYVRMERRVDSLRGKEAFAFLSQEEKAHLQRLSLLLGKKM